MEPNRFDATAINDFRKCPEYYRSRHELGLRRDTLSKGAPEAGQALHSALDAWFKDEGLGAAKQAIARSWGPDPVMDAGAKPKFTQGFLQAIMAGYANAWPREDDPWQVTASEDYVEHDFDVFVWCGLRDRVVENASGRSIADTKSSSLRLDAGRKQQFGLSTQFMGYQAMEEAKGREVDSVILDYIQTDTRGKKVKPEHFQRVEYRFNGEHIAQWLEATTHTVEEITRLRETLGIDKRWPQHDHRCFDYFRPCPYLERCQVGQAEAQYVGNYRIEFWDPKNLVEAK